jgi:transposase InsO family protein
MKLKGEYPLTEVCAVLDCPRSGVYYVPQRRDDEPKLREAIRRLAGLWPTYGYRRVTALLRREGWTVNTKRVRRLMRGMGLQAQVKRTKRRTTNSQHAFPRYPNLVKDRAVTFPDQVWVADITYIRLLTEFVYLAVLMDVFTRAMRGWHLGRALDQDLTLTALRQALKDRCPEIHHADQGVQYAATAYTDLLTAHGVRISMAAVGAPEENPFAERLIRTIKEEEVDLSEYLDYHDAYQHLGRFLEDVYMHKRIHSSLGYLTPSEFERQWLTQQSMLEVIQ